MEHRISEIRELQASRCIQLSADWHAIGWNVGESTVTVPFIGDAPRLSDFALAGYIPQAKLQSPSPGD
jgi:hypothetical protein